MDEENIREKRLSSLSVVLPLSATEEDAKEAASDLIENQLKIQSFEILDIKLAQVGQIQTPVGIQHGKRYIVAFHQTRGETVYIHPEYEKLIKSGW